MAQPTTGVYFSQSTPGAPPGDQIAQPQTDGASPEQSVTFVPQRATTALRGTVKPDGTTITIDTDGTIHAVATGGGGSGSGGTSASGGLYVCVSPTQDPADGTRTQWILPAPQLAGTIGWLVRNDAMQRQLGQKAYFSVQGTQLTLTSPLEADGYLEYYYIQGTPSSETGGGGSVTPATIRGSIAITTATASLVLNFPAGSQAGDLAVLFCANSGNSGPVPSGWTAVANGGQPAGISDINWLGFAAWRILTSGDISTGSVTVDTHGPFIAPISDVAAAMVTFIGASSGVREGHVNPTGSTVSNPDVIATSSAVLSSDIGIFFGCSALRGAGTISASLGSVLQSPNTVEAMAVLAIANMPGGVSNISFTRTGAFDGAADFVVIVEP